MKKILKKKTKKDFNANDNKSALKNVLSAEMNTMIMEKEEENDLSPISKKQLQKHEQLINDADIKTTEISDKKIESYLKSKGFNKKISFLFLNKNQKNIVRKSELKEKNIQVNSVETQKDLSDKIDAYARTIGIKKIFSYIFLSKDQKRIIKNKKIASNESIEMIKADYNLDNVFEVKDFNLWYNNRHKQALFNININLKRRKVTALIGPSGCGKSTFIRCLNRMNDLIPNIVTEGNIYFDNGVNVKSKKLDRLELTTRVGMVFQKPSPFPMSIYENVAYGPKSHGVLEKKVLDQIVKNSLIGAALWDEVKNSLHDLGTSLSGGQQQRLCIARAIALEPEVLLMDEPTSGLDPIATSKIENLINHLKQKYTIIIVTHSMAQAQRISDETVFFYQGEVIEHGSTKQIFTSPKQKKTKDYISGRIG